MKGFSRAFHIKQKPEPLQSDYEEHTKQCFHVNTICKHPQLEHSLSLAMSVVRWLVTTTNDIKRQSFSYGDDDQSSCFLLLQERRHTECDVQIEGLQGK